MPKQVKLLFKRREFIVLLGPPSLSQDIVDVMIPIGPAVWAAKRWRSAYLSIA